MAVARIFSGGAWRLRNRSHRDALRQASPGRLIVSVDQEGGRTSRLNPSNGFPATKSEAEIGAEDSTAATRAWAQVIVDSLTSVGANLNYAPVVDLDVNPDNPAIGKLGRSFSADADVVVRNATEEIQVHRAAGVKTVLKHFPGSGSATGNTDFEVVDVSTTWQSSELEPFRRLIDSGMADSVMAAHVLNKQLDPSRPASLSRTVVTDLLRGRLGWQGAVVSDDMQAVAISRRYGRGEAVAMALEAGLDLLVFANQQVGTAPRPGRRPNLGRRRPRCCSPISHQLRSLRHGQTGHEAEVDGRQRDRLPAERLNARRTT